MYESKLDRIVEWSVITIVFLTAIYLFVFCIDFLIRFFMSW